MRQIKMSAKDVLELWIDEQVTVSFHRGKFAGNVVGYLEKAKRGFDKREYEVYVVKSNMAFVEFSAYNVVTIHADKHITVQ